MKPSTDWTEGDIQNLIDQGIKESSNLEYKACGALRTDGFVYDKRTGKYLKRDKIQTKEHMIHEISKDVSSFANADGGTIVYGVIEDNHIPLKIDKYPYEPSEVSKEWLENIIDSNIKRKIEGIKINQIELRESNSDKVIYAVYIPQSLQGAHQANDCRYYQRRNFKAEPLEDYQVRDVMNRFNFPIMEAKPEFKLVKSEQNEHRYAFGLTLANVGNVITVNFGVDIYFPRFLLDTQNYNELLTKGFFEGRLTKEDIGYVKICYRNFGTDYILFPSESITVLDWRRKNRISYIVNTENWERCYQYRIKLTIFADNMPPKREEYNNYQGF